ncbi:hypothetical protein SELMODRAFT_431149 [Selaginella moellendorffii]|uniref:Glycosyltransferase 2-like domain-containing protein n=1 Tax=Selaginella moellendorffii TaxID=88036 RepID=D8TBP2_SELML|nr:hypothetical protein SELMODRAFT_431149 [Selaginella moellendorffii]
MDYPKHQFRVLVLDDGGDDELKRYCEELESACVKYLRRKKIPGVPHNFKCGNLNYGLEHSDAEFVVTMDADMILHPSFLKTLLPHIVKDPKVSFVQIPQSFYNLPVGDPLNDACVFGYERVMIHRDTFGAAPCVRTGAIFRRKHLDEIGGFQPMSITEDTMTAFKLFNQDFKSVYLNRKLQIGLTPWTFEGYIKQRRRWCQGAIQQFSATWREMLGPKSKLSLVLKSGSVFHNPSDESHFWWMTPFFLQTIYKSIFSYSSTFTFTPTSSIDRVAAQAKLTKQPALIKFFLVKLKHVKVHIIYILLVLAVVAYRISWVAKQRGRNCSHDFYVIAMSFFLLSTCTHMLVPIVYILCPPSYKPGQRKGLLHYKEKVPHFVEGDHLPKWHWSAMFYEAIANVVVVIFWVAALVIAVTKAVRQWCKTGFWEECASGLSSHHLLAQGLLLRPARCCLDKLYHTIKRMKDDGTMYKVQGFLLIGMMSVKDLFEGRFGDGQLRAIQDYQLSFWLEDLFRQHTPPQLQHIQPGWANTNSRGMIADRKNFEIVLLSNIDLSGAIRKLGGDDKNMSVSVDLGDMECTVDSQYVSNHSFTEAELVEWWRERWKAGKRLIPEAELQAKLAQRHNWGEARIFQACGLCFVAASKVAWLKEDLTPPAQEEIEQKGSCGHDRNWRTPQMLELEACDMSKAALDIMLFD